MIDGLFGEAVRTDDEDRSDVQVVSAGVPAAVDHAVMESGVPEPGSEVATDDVIVGYPEPVVTDARLTIDECEKSPVVESSPAVEIVVGDDAREDGDSAPEPGTETNVARIDPPPGAEMKMGDDDPASVEDTMEGADEVGLVDEDEPAGVGAADGTEMAGAPAVVSTLEVTEPTKIVASCSSEVTSESGRSLSSDATTPDVS